ncbi:MAG: anhydro-N-acetylmuramic acid kinase [Alphaproteobacteria bacterium]|jgi:anhydro-N-acetylmuramic acid kinase
MTKPIEIKQGHPVWALGLMSGTSMDGIDGALVLTDGETVFETGPALSIAYDADFRARLALAVSGKADGEEILALTDALTVRHGEVVRDLLADWPKAKEVAVIGFHGHTLYHKPKQGGPKQGGPKQGENPGETCQIGNGAQLARLSNLPVVNDFRTQDMLAGGEGAPFAPLYHLARLKTYSKARPVVILNLGGVANVTWVGNDPENNDDQLLAFDTGPACAFIDDWVLAHEGRPFDQDGALAASGTVSKAALAALLECPWFSEKPPKSLDRFGFDLAPVAGLSAPDGAATLTAFSAGALARAMEHFPARPVSWFATGGGRHNPVLMAAIGDCVGCPIGRVEDIGWRGDTLEAEAFGFLAVRSLRGLPLSHPRTTGAERAVTGGRLHYPD